MNATDFLSIIDPMQKKFSKKIEGTIPEQKLAKAECIGKYLTERIGNRSVVELCSCLGIALIQIAKNTDKKVVGVDISGDLVTKAKKNADIYGCDNITFVEGDAMNEELLDNLDAEVVIIDPHWSKSKTLSRDFATKLDDTQPPSEKIVELVRKHITKNIIIELPPNMSNKEIQKLGNCEIQEVYINGKLMDKTVYLGDLVEEPRSKVYFEYEKDVIPDELRDVSFS